ncbi:MAG: hypothetical protein ACXAC8_19075 [Candidatus Hodarchaeales archaeon]|jgi:hypothetical protein
MVLNSESPVIGIIISSFSDAGPEVIFNSTGNEVSEDQALNLSIRIMTVIGQEIIYDLYGPLPVPSNDEYLCLAYVFRVKSTYTIDPRLKERPIVICIIFKRILKRNISRAHGLILSYLTQVTSKDFKKEDDLKSERMIEIHKRLASLIATNPVRIYIVEEEKIKEHLGSLDVPSDAYLIADKQKNIIYIIFDPFLSPLRKRQVVILVDALNEKTYRRRFNKKIVDSEDDASRLMNYYGLKHRKQL